MCSHVRSPLTEEVEQASKDKEETARKLEEVGLPADPVRVAPEFGERSRRLLTPFRFDVFALAPFSFPRPQPGIRVGNHCESDETLLHLALCPSPPSSP